MHCKCNWVSFVHRQRHRYRMHRCDSIFNSFLWNIQLMQLQLSKFFLQIIVLTVRRSLWWMTYLRECSVLEIEIPASLGRPSCLVLQITFLKCAQNSHDKHNKTTMRENTINAAAKTAHNICICCSYLKRIYRNPSIYSLRVLEMKSTATRERRHRANCNTILKYQFRRLFA